MRGYLNESGYDTGDEDIVPETKLEKVCILLRGREDVLLERPRTREERDLRKEARKRRAKQSHSKGAKKQPEFQGKNEFLHYIEAHDYIKSHHKWKTSLNLLRTLKKTTSYEKTKRGKKKVTKSIVSSIKVASSKVFVSTNSKTKKPKMTKLE